MPTFAQLSVGVLISFSFFIQTFAQNSAHEADRTVRPVVTASASQDLIRFTAPGKVTHMRLEIYSSLGVRILDTEIKGGNVLDWILEDSDGQRLSSGFYLCVVTVKSLSGRLIQRVGLVSIDEKNVTLEPAEPNRLTAAQQQAVGPLEENAGVVILKPGQAGPTTVIAHNGNEGQVIRSKGALSFRLGDFFSAKDEEQMRLTEEGNLGIGTSEPKAKLDVAGTIRAERILIAKPKSVVDSQTQSNVASTTESTDSVQPLASGSGTQGRIAKWTDNGGTLGDSLLNESGNTIELRSLSGGVGVNPTLTNPSTNPGFAQFQFYPAAGPDTNMSFSAVPRGGGAANNHAQISVFKTDFIADPNNYEFLALRARDADFVLGTGKSGAGLNRSLMLASGFLSDNITNNAQLYLSTNGNVGIGAAAPGFKLHVVDPGNSGLRVQTNIAGGTVASFGGNGEFQIDSPGVNGGRFLVKENGNVGIGTNPSARLSVVGVQPAATNASVGTAATPVLDVIGGKGGSGMDAGGTGANVSIKAGDGGDAQGFGFPEGGPGGSIFLLPGVPGRPSGRDGGVGVGTTTPFGKLDVAGNVFVRGYGTIFPNPGGIGELEVGMKFGAPGTVGSVPRLALGSYGNIYPWVFEARDDTTKAYMDWHYYPSTGITQDSNGNLGIGATAPTHRLEVSGGGFAANVLISDNNTNATTLDLGNTSSSKMWRLQTMGSGVTGRVGNFELWDVGGLNVLTIQPSGNVGLGTLAPDNKLTVNGTADKPGGGSWSIFSDERLKNLKGNFTLGLHAVMRLHPLRYEYKRDNALGIKSEGEHIGFSAQQVQRIIPEAVSRDDKGYLLVDNDPILWTMLNAIKEQQKQIEDLKTEIQKFRTAAHRRTIRHPGRT